MPLARTDLNCGAPVERGGIVGQAVCDAIIAVATVPAYDRCRIVTAAARTSS